MSRCEQEKPLFRWQSTFSSGFKGRWSTCSFLSEEQTAPSGLLFHVRFGIAHCCLVSFIKKRKRGDHFFFPNKTLVRRLPLVSQPGGHLPVLDVPPHPHVSKTAPEQHWSKEAAFRLLGMLQGSNLFWRPKLERRLQCTFSFLLVVNYFWSEKFRDSK